MTPIAKRMWNKLAVLNTTNQERYKHDPVTLIHYLITYGQLVDLCGLFGTITPKGTGPYLKEIAEKCRDEKLPPLNALVVNQDSHIPGDSYDGSGGFSIANWNIDLMDVIKHQYKVEA